MSNNRPFPSEATDFVLRALEQSSQPLGVTKLNKAIPKSAPFQKKQLPELLQQMVESGQIRAHGARTAVYWLPIHEDQACARIVEALDERPLTQTELKEKFKSRLIGWPPTKRTELVERLIKEKRVYKVPALTGKPKLLSIRPQLTLQDGVRLAIHLVVAKLAAQGFTSEEVLAAAREALQPTPATPAGSAPAPAPANLEQLILDRMTRLKPAASAGALVSLSELRNTLAVELPTKQSFDQAILRLAETGRFALHHHDFPSSLSQEERDALVLDERGNYYIGIVLRA
jgi:hypothetical protein